MPSFPDSVFAPPNRSNGQTADASHMNGVQDELVAIEGGYLNATARLNSSNSTLANLSVTGGTTLVGGLTLPGQFQSSNSTVNALQVSSNSTFSGAATFGGLMIMPGREMCAVVHGSSQTLSAAAETAVTFNEEIVDVGNFHSTTTNPTRLTCQSSGTFAMIGAVVFDAAGTAERYAYWRVNGTSNAGSRAENAGQGTAAFVALAPWAVHRAASSGDYFELMVSTSAVPLNNGGGTLGGASRAYIVRMA